MEFTTVITNESISVYEIPKYLDLHKETEINDVSAKATVKWRIEIEARDWGIKDISTIVESIDIDIDVEYYDFDDVECEDKIFRNFGIESKEFKILSDDFKVKDNAVIRPDYIEVDLEKRTITIS